MRICRNLLLVVLLVKNLPANAGDIRDVGLIPGLGRSPGEGHGNPLQYSCLENPMDRGAWWATVHRVAKSWTWLKRLNMHIVTKLKNYCLRETNQASISETKKICHNFNLPFFHCVSLNNFILSYCWLCGLSSFYSCTMCLPNMLHVPYLLLDVSRSF